MTDGTQFEQREIVFTPVIYSNLKKVKKRPVLILSNNRFNSRSEDLICCSITSNLNRREGISITQADMEEGKIYFDSRVKPSSIHTLNKSLIEKKLGKLRSLKTHQVIEELNKLLGQ